jgi:hypothetical protein
VQQLNQQGSSPWFYVFFESRLGKLFFERGTLGFCNGTFGYWRQNSRFDPELLLKAQFHPSTFKTAVLVLKLYLSASKSPNAPKNAATTQHQVARADVARQQHTQDSTEKASKLKARMNLESPNERGNDARNSFLSF